MSSGLSRQLLSMLVEIECPVCEFGFDIELIDAACQVWRWCPCCRVHIRMIESGGEVYGAMEEIDASMRELEKALRRLSK